MPDLAVGARRWAVEPGSNLLDALNAAGFAVPYSCRAGSCHACLVRCVEGEPLDINPTALNAQKREQGWRLACQCRVENDLSVAVFDPARDGVPAEVIGCDWLEGDVLHLRLAPERPFRYQAGQHLVLWAGGVARPYSLASLPQDDPWLAFHIDCRYPGAFSDAARALQIGDPVQLGELRSGALHYDPDWQTRPLWLLAAGTGLGPLWGILREALRQEHQGPIRLVHCGVQYWREPLEEMARCHPPLQVEGFEAGEVPSMRLQSRQTMALLCGSPASVEMFSRQLYLAGLPRNQMLADVFVGRSV
ncbi:iron-sulfur-binding ferredoxin reductase [Pseudomonas sp. R5(2019)]|uniref:iron-sulfur-binding ferredoxin reductase n=1 Tax=Pseudomonas sp. R5(2019) TaxID=2697566 RepID=UPI0014128116|nr:iron-sulfur-binding ferredoxin reductase [Pseudomonas sp. R5(2019)]NBA94704.1 iron-sulfur-binding ferredoxin reductase [Pseudomonas sp. R5(2019)]